MTTQMEVQMEVQMEALMEVQMMAQMEAQTKAKMDVQMEVKLQGQAGILWATYSSSGGGSNSGRDWGSMEHCFRSSLERRRETLSSVPHAYWHSARNDRGN